MTRSSALGRAAAALLVVISLAACAKQDQRSSLAPTSPLPDRSGTSGSDSSRDSDLASGGNAADPRTASQKPLGTASSASFVLARCENRVPGSYAAVFGPAGGVLEFGGSRLIIPAGALRDRVTISATVMDSTTSRVELQPHGLQFAKPAGLQLGTTDCILSNPDYPAIVYLSPTGDVLETIRAVYDPHWHTIASPIDHFSGYALGF